MRNPYKILAVVMMNGGEAFVLDKKIELQYTKYGNVIIGTDGCFMTFYYYDTPRGSWTAFAGRKFDIPLTDGNIIHCYGQWWDGMSKETLNVLRNELGINPKNIISQTAQDITSLERCYVYAGYRGIKQKIKKLRSRYHGRIYEYWEYEAILKYRLLIKEHTTLNKEIKTLNRALDKQIASQTGRNIKDKWVQEFKQDLINEVKEGRG